MPDKFKAHIFVVDDDSCILEAVCLNLKNAQYNCTCFKSAKDCLEKLRPQSCDLLITDVKMPDKDGIELLSEAKKITPFLPVLIITSYGDIPLAVRAVKAGAEDFIEKPLQWKSFLDVVQSVLEQVDLSGIVKGNHVTRTEAAILHLILQGKTSREVADILDRSVRTIEVHRSHIMHKLGVENIVDLVKKASAMGLDVK